MRHGQAFLSSTGGGVFSSIVVSTATLARHNLAPEHWPTGITAFIVIFAASQIFGPNLVGKVADGGGRRCRRGYSG